MSEIEFRYTYEQGNFKFPLFKFLQKEYAQALFRDGDVYLPLLSDFAHSDDGTDSLIYDTLEGTCELHLNGSDVVKNARLPDSWVYCTAAQLLSASINWALKEGKTSCIMITEPQKFALNLRAKMTDSTLSEFVRCNYSDEPRIVKDDTDIRQYYFSKPRRYHDQREVRLVGMHKDNSQTNMQRLIKIPEISESLIEIDISGIDSEVLHMRKQGRILHEIYMKNGIVGEFEIKQPFGVYSPVIINGQLGFACFDANRSFKDARVDKCDNGMHFSLLAVFALNPITKIEKIIVKTVP